MAVDRRSFLVLGGGLLVGTAACSDSKNAQAQTTLVANNNGDEWDVVRDLFDVDPAYKHFAGFLIVSHPRPVREAIDHHRRELDRNPALYLEHNWQTLDTAPRNAAAKFIGADPGEVAMTDSTTMGLGLLYGGFKLRPGQQVLTTVHDHYSTHEALRFRASRDGANIKKVRLFADSAKATEAEITKRLADAINDRTRIVAVTWVHSSTGMKLPIRALADVVATANKGRAEADRAILCVDGVHGFWVEEFTVVEQGCDFFAAGCHKWLFGPRGTGILWGRAGLWDNVVEQIPPFEMPAFMAWLQGRQPTDVPGGVMHTPGGFHSFEHRWAVTSAFELHQRIGRRKIQDRIHALNRQLKEGLAAMKHVKLYTPMDDALSAGIVCFDVDGLSQDEVVKKLLEDRIIASVTPYRRSYARLAPGLLNTPAEVNAALRAVRKLA